MRAQRLGLLLVFIDLFNELCTQKGVSPNKACIEIGVSRTAVAKWRAGSTPTGNTALKIAEYFGVSTDYLLGKEKSPTSDKLTEELGDLEFALFGEVKDLTDGQKKEILDFVKFKKSQGEWGK